MTTRERGAPWEVLKEGRPRPSCIPISHPDRAWVAGYTPTYAAGFSPSPPAVVRLLVHAEQNGPKRFSMQLGPWASTNMIIGPPCCSLQSACTDHQCRAHDRDRQNTISLMIAQFVPANRTSLIAASCSSALASLIPLAMALPVTASYIVLATAALGHRLLHLLIQNNRP